MSQEAIYDIATFYANTLLKYPNTWSQDMVDSKIEETIKDIESVVIEKIQGEKVPILQNVNDGNTAEFATKNRRWYFTVCKNGDDFYINNAWYKSNASNSAYRRGVSNKNTDLSLDDRRNQKRLKGEGVDRMYNKDIQRIVREVINEMLYNEKRLLN